VPGPWFAFGDRFFANCLLEDSWSSHLQLGSAFVSCLEAPQSAARRATKANPPKTVAGCQKI
jgi:hypothetical protein